MKITLKNISKHFGNTKAVDNFSCQMNDGHLICLLGPSGCGKSTILNMLCGIIKPTSGQIFFDDEDVTNLPPDMRNIGMVFQNYALYPHLTVLENISFPLEIKKVPKKERHEKAKEIAKLVIVDSLLNNIDISVLCLYIQLTLYIPFMMLFLKTSMCRLGEIEIYMRLSVVLSLISRIR